MTKDNFKQTEESLSLVFGKNPVLEIIKNDNIQTNKIWINDASKDNDFKNRVISYAKEHKIPFHMVPEKKLSQLTKNNNHQGIVLSISPVKYLDINILIENVLKNHELKIILIANEIEDPHNLGAIIRTFVAGGGRGIILSGRSNTGLNSTVVKTSAGSMFQADFARAANCTNVINKLKDKGFWIVGTDNSNESESIYKIDFPNQIGIVIGNEHEGLGQLIKKNCDFLTKIPINSKIDSLNVSVAFGIILFEILRRKNK